MPIPKGYQRLDNSTRHIVPKAKRVGPANPNEVISLTIPVRRRPGAITHLTARCQSFSVSGEMSGWGEGRKTQRAVWAQSEECTAERSRREAAHD
jgi:hypothetical protein